MILEADLAAVDTALAPLWPRLEGAHLFITGGTGFIGRWMLKALARAPVDVQVTLLSRNPAEFAARAPHLAARFHCVSGDVLDFAPPQVPSRTSSTPPPTPAPR
ncbi:NAD-dependent epimerase/dehydratase family protein [Sphingomonas sp. Ant H11]|uniref:NAD-dependent epimerase/dehydratase family protein n=1 Tax=Sphingomonas sp. Ant H11 TaxID=1564113 RepID=UPI000AA41DB1|nr:NAD-dependent epimerase/dehydratase family protein [Sphingomonas sp. Ant H11]